MSAVDNVKYGSFGEISHSLFDIRLGDTLAELARERWPSGTRKHVAREWGLTHEQARSVCDGSASKATLEHIFRHKRGRWPLILEVFARFLGEGVEQHLQRQRRSHEERAERLGAIARDLHLASDRGADGGPELDAGRSRQRVSRRSGLGEG